MLSKRISGFLTMRHALALFFAALAAAGFSGPAAAQGIHAALAISVDTGAYGYGYNYDTPQAAQARAMAECRKHATDCKVYVNFSRNCISLARGNTSTGGWAFGWATGYTNEERPERALNECAHQNGNACRVMQQFCSGQ